MKRESLMKIDRSSDARKMLEASSRNFSPSARLLDIPSPLTSPGFLLATKSVRSGSTLPIFTSSWLLMVLQSRDPQPTMGGSGHTQSACKNTKSVTSFSSPSPFQVPISRRRNERKRKGENWNTAKHLPVISRNRFPWFSPWSTAIKWVSVPILAVLLQCNWGAKRRYKRWGGNMRPWGNIQLLLRSPSKDLYRFDSYYEQCWPSDFKCIW